jgi:hypothetical protein
MKCENVKKELEQMYEGGKPGNEALSHIKTCAECRAEYEAMLKITGVLKDMEDVKVPSGFNKAVWDKIGEPAPSLFGKIFRPVFVLSGAAAAALVFFMVFSSRDGLQKKQDTFAAKPPVVKEKIAKKETIEKQEITAPDVKSPVTAQNKDVQVPAPMEKIVETSPGKMPELVKSTGADREYLIKQEDEKNKISAVSVTKRPVELEGPLVIKNNVIKPLSGQGMTITYKVEEACNVLIRVYNRKGEPVKTLVQALQGSGVYTEIWKGEDRDNRVVGDGIYIVHVKTCLTEQKIKAIVVK